MSKPPYPVGEGATLIGALEVLAEHGTFDLGLGVRVHHGVHVTAVP